MKINEKFKGGVSLHAYMKSVGFSDISSRKKMEKLLQDVIKSSDRRKVVEDEEHRLFVEISKEYGYDCGLTVCGELDEEDNLHIDYCFPFYNGSKVTSQEDLVVERHSDKVSYAGACDDYRVGITLIFYLQNAAEYLNEKDKDLLHDFRTSVTLSALAKSGTILLPLKKAEKTVESQQNWQEHNALIAAARNGDEEAMESLTMEDIDTYSSISRRIRKKDDVFSIVDTYFMPYGIECDQYNVMGDIMEYDITVNEYTGEKLHLIQILCNDIPLDICINDKDLVGVPEVGRRFKGVIWLMGKINF